MIFDYGTLKLIWWLFIIVLLLGFAVTDGFDMGVAIPAAVLGKTNDERRVIINTVGPVWEGNQTWFITAGGATFAALAFSPMQPLSQVFMSPCCWYCFPCSSVRLVSITVARSTIRHGVRSGIGRCFAVGAIPCTDIRGG